MSAIEVVIETAKYGYELVEEEQWYALLDELKELDIAELRKPKELWIPDDLIADLESWAIDNWHLMDQPNQTVSEEIVDEVKNILRTHLKTDGIRLYFEGEPIIEEDSK